MKYLLDTSVIEKSYQRHYHKDIKGLRVTLAQVEPFLKSLKSCKERRILGHSEGGLPIYKIVYGNGAKKVLVWSQMHGNEATGTKALLDLYRLLEQPSVLQNTCKQLLQSCQMTFVTILNPDGADLFTRVNKKGIDLNRDATKLNAKESKLLRSVLDEVKPDYCFNLHDQRSIFGVAGTKNPATISFLAPSEEATRKTTEGRKETMGVISVMNELLQKVIPNHVGRYTDEFYPTATGDNFQKMGYPTILIEAGHYPNDEHRALVRKFNFMALLQGLYAIAMGVDFKGVYKPYFAIPTNCKLFYDVIVRKVLQENGNKEDIAYQYHYEVKNDQLQRYLKEMERGHLVDKLGHIEF